VAKSKLIVQLLPVSEINFGDEVFIDSTVE
jgi:hypothetical protein